MALYIGQVPPETPLTGDFWLDSSDGKAKRFDSSKWVELENSELSQRMDSVERKVNFLLSIFQAVQTHDIS